MKNYLALLLLILLPAQVDAGVVNGEPVDATVTNAAFINKNQADSDPYQLSLTNSSSGFGSSITDIQTSLNAINSFLGMTLNSAYNVTPSWTNNQIGSSTDSIFYRTNAITGKFDGTSGHMHTGVQGDGPQIPLGSSVTGTLQPVNGGFGVSSPAANSVPIAEGSSAFDFVTPATAGYAFFSNGTGIDPSYQQIVPGLINFNASVIPAADDLYNLGSSADRWATLYVQSITGQSPGSGAGTSVNYTSGNGSSGNAGGTTTIGAGTGNGGTTTSPSITIPGGGASSSSPMTIQGATYTFSLTGQGQDVNVVGGGSNGGNLHGGNVNLDGGAQSGSGDDGKVTATPILELKGSPSSLDTQLPNASSTGTTLSQLVVLTGAGTVVNASTSNTTGLIGIVTAGAGTSGNADVAQAGQVNCVFDNATTENDYVIASTTTGGECHDAGATQPSGTAQILGRVLSTNGSAGTYTLLLTLGGGSGGVAYPMPSPSPSSIAMGNGSSWNAIPFPSPSPSMIVMGTSTGFTPVPFPSPSPSGSYVQTTGIGFSATNASTTFNNVSPLTTKGDTLSYSTQNVRQAVPGDNGRLVPDSSQTDGWRSATYTQFQNGVTHTKNYVQYGDFENGATTGWSLGTVGTLTNGLPTGSPTFGSGASGNLSISATASSPVAGVYSLSYASTAATTQGNMVASSSYAIDTEDEAKVLGVQFAYSVSSGASNDNFSGTSSNSFAWAIYDVTNSAWLPSAGNFCMIQNVGVGLCSGTVQTASTTANVRLVIYNANASSGATTMYFDDVYVGPQQTQRGPAMTDWTAYTPTFTGFGTVSTQSFYSRRVGDSLEVQGSFTSGTSTATTAQVTLGYGGGNGNVTCDTTKLSTNNLNAVGIVGPSYSAAQSVYALAPSSNQDYFEFGIQSSSTNSLAAVNGSTVASSGNVLSVHFVVPIVGWSSFTTMSTDTDTRVVAMQVFQNQPTATVTSSASIVKFGSPSTLNDTHGGYSESTGLYTVPVTGYYRVTASFVIGATYVANNTSAVYVYQNGSSVAATDQNGAASQTELYPSIAVTLKCNSGDTIAPYVSSAGSSPSITSSAGQNYFTVERLSGPAVVAATESVEYRGTNTAGTSIATTATEVPWPTTTKDTHSGMNTSTGTYTVPVSGQYLVCAVTGSAGVTLTTGQAWQMYLYHNGSSYSTLQFQWGNGNSGVEYFASGCDQVTCLAGDTLAIYNISSASSSLNTTAGYNHLSIVRVGN